MLGEAMKPYNLRNARDCRGHGGNDDSKILAGTDFTVGHGFGTSS